MTQAEPLSFFLLVFRKCLLCIWTSANVNNKAAPTEMSSKNMNCDRLQKSHQSSWQPQGLTYVVMISLCTTETDYSFSISYESRRRNSLLKLLLVSLYFSIQVTVIKVPWNKSVYITNSPWSTTLNFPNSLQQVQPQLH